MGKVAHFGWQDSRKLWGRVTSSSVPKGIDVETHVEDQIELGGE